jgi:hypothetical protein
MKPHRTPKHQTRPRHFEQAPTKRPKGQNDKQYRYPDTQGHTWPTKPEAMPPVHAHKE